MSGNEFPEPIKYNLPNWFKNLSHDHNNKTIKGCMPFMDTLTCGYLLKLPQDVHIKHGFKNEEGKKYTYLKYALSDKPKIAEDNYLNNVHPEVHPETQFKGSSFSEQNGGGILNKWINPWIIKTPPGYSCLLIPPLNNKDDRFEIISGIVDTDTYDRQINFPFILNSIKYPELDTIISKGTPIVQVIPFRRDQWKMEVGVSKVNKVATILKESFYLLRNYQKMFWRKKKWD
tara:strand:+ start:1405 stop:2097 length:693 start_codon:yes stop_codon:yes gene_type:complete